MNCTMCGAIIPTGQSNCPMCGAPVSADQPTPAQTAAPQPGQPVNPQPGYGQPMGSQPNPQMGYGQPMNGQPNPQMGYGQPMNGQPNPQMGYYQPKSNAVSFNTNGYVGYLTSNPMNILKIAAAILLFITAFLPWAKASYWGSSVSYNLFKAGGVNVFFAIMILLLSVILIGWEIGDFIPSVANVKAKLRSIPYIELIIIGLALVFVILSTIRVSYVHEDGMTANLTDWGADVSRTAGCILAYIAVVAAAVPRILDIAGVRIGRR